MNTPKWPQASDSLCFPSCTVGANTPSLPDRLKSRMPSYCDETLFGTKSGQSGPVPWMKEEDTAKLRTLLWTPPSVSRNHPSRPSCQKEEPLRAVRRETPRSQQTEGFGVQYREHSFWKLPENSSDEDNQGALGSAGYQPVGRVQSASETFQPPETDSRTDRRLDRHLPDASVASPGSWPRSKGVSRSPSAIASRATGSNKPRPPWK